MSKEEWSEGDAPEGAVWVCPCCGKYNKNRYRVGDESCYINAVLAYEDSLKIEKGRVVDGRPVERRHAN